MTDWAEVQRAAIANAMAAERLRKKTREERARRMRELAIPDRVGRSQWRR